MENGFASNGYGSRSPGGYGLGAALLIEIVLTAAFLYIILGSTDDRAPKGFAPISIGLALTLIHLISIPVTNTSVNPARSLGVAWFAGGAALSQVWLFIVAFDRGRGDRRGDVRLHHRIEAVARPVFAMVPLPSALTLAARLRCVVMIKVPAALARETGRRHGAVGRAWLTRLPALVAELVERWDLVIDGDLRHGGVALVVPVSLAGEVAVLKVSFPHPANASEPYALAAFDGRGAVRLLDHHDDQFAMLLERAHDVNLGEVADTDAAVQATGAIAYRLARAAPAAMPRLCDTVAGWEAQLLDQDRHAQNDQPLPERVVAMALDTICALGQDRTDTMTHGDLHFGNILRAEREPWLAVDPKGLVGTAAFEAGTVIRERPIEIVGCSDPLRAATRRLTIFSDAAMVDIGLSLSLAQARLVSSYYWEAQHQQQPESVDLLRSLCLTLTP